MKSYDTYTQHGLDRDSRLAGLSSFPAFIQCRGHDAGPPIRLTVRQDVCMVDVRTDLITVALTELLGASNI